MAEPTTKLQGQSTPLTDKPTDKPKDEVKVTPAAPAPKAPVFTTPASGVRPGSGQVQEQKPSLGRIVLYHHSLYEGGCSPAIVTGVCSERDVVDLTVFFKNQAPYGVSDVSRGDDEGMWNWPPKV